MPVLMDDNTQGYTEPLLYDISGVGTKKLHKKLQFLYQSFYVLDQ